jgi:hypothetical protein
VLMGCNSKLVFLLSEFGFTVFCELWLRIVSQRIWFSRN